MKPVEALLVLGQLAAKLEARKAEHLELATIFEGQLAEGQIHPSRAIAATLGWELEALQDARRALEALEPLERLCQDFLGSLLLDDHRRAAHLRDTFLPGLLLWSHARTIPAGEGSRE